jgi:hypothetical protein
MKPKLMTYAAVITLVAAAASPFAIALRCSSASAQTSTAPPSTSKSAAEKATSKMMARVEKRISALHSQLKITAAEESLWQQFADVMRENAQKMNQRTQKLQSMNAVESMKSYADLVVEHGQDLQTRATAFEKLYNTMPPDQQKLADQVFRGRAAPQQRHH